MSSFQSSELILKSAEIGLTLQETTGSMPAGHNGPYHDPETPVRNTAHWAIVFCSAFAITGDEHYKKAAKKCYEWLIGEENKYYQGFTYKQREKIGKDQENGVIGPAWTIESLVFGYRYFNDKRLLNRAEEIHNSLKFDVEKGLWKRCSFDGKEGPIDMTFNHQLWYAYAVAYLSKTNGVPDTSVQIFLSNIHNNLKLYRDGCIRHSTYPWWGGKTWLKGQLKSYYHLYLVPLRGKSIRYKEEGYHIFNVFAFARLKDFGIEHDFFSSNSFNRILKFSYSKRLQSSLDLNQDNIDFHFPGNNTSVSKCNRYGYPYNVPGYESLYIARVFNLDEQSNANWAIERQLEIIGTNWDEYNTEDVQTLTARVYELCFNLDFKEYSR